MFHLALTLFCYLLKLPILLQLAVLGNTKEERKKKIFGCPSDDTSCAGGGGLNVYITLNLEYQQHANQILNKWVPSEITDEESDEQTPTGVITLIFLHLKIF